MTYQNQLTATSPIKVTKHADRTRTVTYFDKVVGHYAPVRHIRAGERRWRCVSVHGQLAYAWSETHARNVLLEFYH
jgi:hypothetical protein